MYFHPRLFLYPSERSTLAIGYHATYEDRKGGDMVVLRHKADSLHRYYSRNRSMRNTFDAGWEYKVRKTDRLNVKASVSLYSRDISTAVFGMRSLQN
jgi:hypothetical protein